MVASNSAVGATDSGTGISVKFDVIQTGGTAGFSSTTIPSDLSLGNSIKNGFRATNNVGSEIVTKLTLSNLDVTKPYEVWVLASNSTANQTQRISVEGSEIYATFNQAITTANQLWVNSAVGSNALALADHASILVPTPLHGDVDDDGDIDTVVRVNVTELVGFAPPTIAGVAIREYTPLTSFSLPATGGPFTLSIQNGSRVLRNSSNATLAIFDSAGAITINGTAGANDLLTVSMAGGNPLAGGVTFHGGAGGSDALTVTGGATSTVAHEFANANDGSVTLSGAIAGTIFYTGLEPITDNLAAADRSFTFNGGSETITLADAAGAAMTIDSTRGESVTFANPTTSITINAGSGDDAVQIQGVDGAFVGNLTVHGEGATDTIEFLSNATLLGAGALVASAETINVSADVTATGGVTLAADAMSLAAAVNAGTAAVSLKQQSIARPIVIGTETVDSLSLTDAELDLVTAATVNVGDANSGDVSITATISPANYKTLSIHGPASFTSTGGFEADISSAAVLERLQVAGNLTIHSSATLSVQAIGGFVPAASDSFLVIENFSGGTTTGAFAGKPEGSNVSLGGVDKKITYSGGAGSNDVQFSPGSRILTWTGGDIASDLWSDPDNWDLNPTNGVPDPAVPQSGDNLVIPATGESEKIVVDQSLSVNSITTDGTGTFEPLEVPFGVTLTLGNAAGPYAFGAVTVNGGTVAGPGTVTNAAGQTLVMQYGTINAPLSNQGLMLVRGNFNAINGNLTTAVGSIVRIQADANLDSATLTVDNGFTNNGSIELTSINGAMPATLAVANGTLVNATGRSIEV